ncbi:hypothetical protein GQ54DRAFT_306676 [Martensiomyces pterosporus]|nr:hypothetical protein GQ54DRAFT_306676 [Martensiomyces pterosporus]
MQSSPTWNSQLLSPDGGALTAFGFGGHSGSMASSRRCADGVLPYGCEANDDEDGDDEVEEDTDEADVDRVVKCTVLAAPSLTRAPLLLLVPPLELLTLSLLAGVAVLTLVRIRILCGGGDGGWVTVWVVGRGGITFGDPLPEASLCSAVAGMSACILSPAKVGGGVRVVDIVSSRTALSGDDVPAEALAGALHSCSRSVASVLIASCLASLPALGFSNTLSAATLCDVNSSQDARRPTARCADEVDAGCDCDAAAVAGTPADKGALLPRAAAAVPMSLLVLPDEGASRLLGLAFALWSRRSLATSLNVLT